MNVLFSVSLWLALIMSSCCGNVGSREKEEPTTAYYDDYTVTPTPDYSDDYDYNATFDYYYVTMAHNPRNEVSGIHQPTLLLSLAMAVLQLWN